MTLEFTDNQLAASFFDQQPQPAFWMTPIVDDGQQIIDFEYRYCNQEFYHYTGLKPEVVVGNRLSNSPAISSPEARKRLFEELLNVYQNGHRTKDWIFNADLNKYYSYTRNRIGGGVLTVLQDRTEEFEMMRQLEEQKTLVDRILVNSSNGISVTEMIRDANGTIIDAATILANDAAVKFTGLPKDIYLSKKATELDPNILQSPYGQMCLNTLATGEPSFSQYFLEVTGRWLELTISKMDDDHLIHIFTDVTPIKEAQLQSEQAAERLRAVFNASQSGMFIFAPVKDDAGEVGDFRFVITNPSFASYIGQTPDVLKDELGSKWFPGYLTNGVFDMYKKTYLTGETLRQDVHYNVDQHDLYLDLMSTKIHDEVLITFNDYSNIKKAQLELEKLVEELRQSNVKLEEFAHAASHDLKEPIRKVSVFSGRLKNSLSNRMQEDERKMFERMENATERMSLLVDDLLSYSHVTMTEFQMEEVDLNRKLRLVLADLELPIEEKKATVNIEPLPVVKGYRRQLQQLFQNLVSNALKYSKPDQPPIITITSSITTGDKTPLKLPPRQQFHLIQVKDNGIGFEQENAERIFQMFHRLHGRTEYAGTGIGLAIAKKVVENHKGYIWAESEPGKGATFNVLLPAI